MIGGRAMKKIQTVQGLLDPDKLGITLIHEHFVCGHPGWEGDQTIAPFDRTVCVQKGLHMAEEIKKYGVKTVVDGTPNDLGRNPEILKEISEKGGINIVCASGYFAEAEGGSRYFRTLSQFADGLSMRYELLKKEVNDGIRDTGIKAGMLKLATGKGTITNYEEMFFKAAARVSKEDRIPIFAHTEEGTMGPEQADLLLSEGADPKLILIGHSCGNPDISYLTRILKKGVYIGFDRFGIEGVFGTPTDTERETALVDLISKGYGSQIMISHDWMNHWLSRPIVNEIVPMILPKWKPTHIFENILPDLKKAGIKEEQISNILVDNPRRYLAGI
jgi:phosphotriesterase-related protein